MRKITTAILISLCSTLVLTAQNSAMDKYYQDKITSNITLGKNLIAANENEEGLNYLKEAIKIAAEREHDYIAAIILINEKAFDPIINHFYDIDSIAIARQFIDLHYELYKRYPSELIRHNEITDAQYADYLAGCYMITAALPQSKDDYTYAIKYHCLYVDNARANNLLNEEYFSLSESLMWEYLYAGEYEAALLHSIDIFRDKKNAGMSDEEAIRMAQVSFNWVNRECRSKPEITQAAKDVCDIWLSFLNPLYEEKGDAYMDSLLMKLDQHSTWREEIIYDMTSTTRAAAMMSRCSYELQLVGYDAAKNELFSFRRELYDKGLAELWPIASFNFMAILENRKLHTATYSFCKTVEQDYLASKELTQKDLLYFYAYYFGACDVVGDIPKSFDICYNVFEQVKDNDDLYWLASRLRGSFYLQIGRFEDGLLCMLSALEHYKLPVPAQKGDVIIYAGLYSYVGQAYRRLGRTDDAIEYFQKCISLCDKYEIPENKLHPYFELGRIFHNKGDLEKARKCFISCADIQSLTGTNYETSSPFSYLFDIERQCGNVNEARKYLESTWRSTLNEYLEFRDYLTVQEQTSYWTKEGDISLLGGLVYESAPSYNDIFYDMLLASKGFLLKAEVTEFSNVFDSGDARLQELYSITHSGTGHTREETDQYMELYRSHHFSSGLENSSWKNVQSMLAKNDVAIEFFQYVLNDSKYTPQYGALVLKAGWKNPKFYHLCSASDLERAVKAKQRVYSVDGLLYGLIWEPIAKDLKGVKNIYFSPQGLLHTLNLSAITDAEGVPMLKSYNMYRLSSTQSIAAISNPSVRKSYIYGGLVYDSDDATMLEEHRKYSRSGDITSETRWAVDASSSRHGWSYLPNTMTETDNISNLLRKTDIYVTQYSGATGTEESFKALSGTRPDLIHLATHGFYLNYSYTDSTAIAESHEKQIAASQNALIRSGLILSNGGRAWKGESIPAGVEDGILQADEIANINLSGTSLLVLSACETALGDISSDGVYGLQRAFKLAGVGTIIMSLWEVDDKATALFMSYFYEAWTSGKNKHDSFVVAQDHLMSQYSDPYYWAAFIMLD